MKPLFNIRINKIAVFGIIISLLIANHKSHAQHASAVSFAVKKEGKGKPVIFIPGLDCSADVWDATVSHFKNNFECYAITLPGFAGQPAIQSDSILNAITDQLALYIKENKLHKPVIVGHSLGGWLALNFAIKYPGLAGDIVCVSSAPFLPALSMGSSISIDSARKIGVMIKKGMENLNPQQVKIGQQYYLKTMIRDSDKIAEVTGMAVKSDQKTQGQVMYELFSTDLRPAMGRVQSKVLVLGDWVAYKQYGATHQSVYDAYKEQFQRAPKVSIAMNDESKHFIMFDEPQWFYEQLESFLTH